MALTNLYSLQLDDAEANIVGGSTSLRFRNAANTQSNLLINDDGTATLLGAITLSGGLIIADDQILKVGTSGDGAFVNRSTVLNANTALSGVATGTPASATTPANSIIISNITADGDIVFLAVPTATHSREFLRVDASAALLVVNEAGADVDFRAEGDNNTSMLAIDAGTDSVALGRAVVAGAFLTVDGSAVNRDGVTSVGRGEHMPTATFTQTNANPTVLAVGARVFVGAPTFAGANAAQTITDAATLFVAAPVQGANMTLTRNWTAVVGGRLGLGPDPTAIVHDINTATLVVFNEQGADIDWRVEGDTNANAIVVDAGTDSLAFGAGVTAGAFLTVDGSAANRAGVTSVGRELHAPAVTFTQTNGDPTTLAIGARMYVGAPTFAGSAANQTISDAATIFIAAPVQGANMTLTRNWTAVVGGRLGLGPDPTAIVHDINTATLVVFNEQGADIDWRVEGDTNANAIVVDAGTDSLAFGAGVTAGAFLTISGSAANRDGVTAVGRGVHLPAVTYTQTNANPTVLAVGGAIVIGIPTFAGTNAAQTITDCATLYLAGVPVAGANMTLTRPYTLWVDAGSSRFDDGVELGFAGATLGLLKFNGNTGGTLTMQSAATAGDWTFTLPPDDGDAGEQLQTSGAGVTTWEAAGSLREVKDLLGVLDPKEALRRVTSAPVYRFRYKAGARPTTGDYQTEYAGPVADEAPWIVHHGGRIFNPVSGVGHALAAIQALAAEVAELRQQLADLRKPTKRSA